MSFVKDDHSFTRGVGAVAAMDAASPRRRRAAARAGAVMARRDAILARHTLGRINQEAPDGGGGSAPAAGGGTGVLPTRSTSTLLSRVSAATRTTTAVLVKDPGSVLEPIRLPTSTTSTPIAPPIQTAPSPTAPPRPIVMPLPGSSSPFSPTPSRPAYVPPDMSTDQIPDVSIEVPAAKGNSKNVLLYAAIGVGALYFLTRNK